MNLKLKPKKAMFRPVPWVDLGSMQSWFGIQMRTDTSKWTNVAVDGKALNFSSYQEAQSYIKEHLRG